MSVGAILAVHLASFANRDGELNKPLESLQRELAVGNISAAQQALAQYTKDLAAIEGRNNRAAETTGARPGGSIGKNVQGLQNALATGDVIAAQNALRKARQSLRKALPGKLAPAAEIDSVQNREQVEGVDSKIAAQVAASLATNGGVLNIHV